MRGKELCILRKAWILCDFIQQGWRGRKMTGEKKRERCKEMWEKYERLIQHMRRIREEEAEPSHCRW